MIFYMAKNELSMLSDGHVSKFVGFKWYFPLSFRKSDRPTFKTGGNHVENLFAILPIA